MQHFLMVFYVLFFATGFMGGAALLLLNMRVRSRLLPPLLLFQLLFLLGLGILLTYFYLQNLLGGLSSLFSLISLLLITGINISLYLVMIVLIRRASPPSTRRGVFPAAAEILVAMVILMNLADMVMTVTSTQVPEVWNLGEQILVGLAVAALGVMLRTPLQPNEPPVLKPLMKAYGLCALIFAPLGLIEYAIASSGILGFSEFSVDYLFYLGWNIVSMSAAVRLFKMKDSGAPALDSVPAERVKSLGLSTRETEMAVMIARGLSNKEIASELYISPATVRTHIYNLYRKADARSRVELINKLRG
ncbi:MAG: helix-turn-helix transcriptional regulator [Spirochaetales bacterium]|nr:helix-turn-helix transcriptional regulator [Spirochaetales bacterium]